MHGGWRSSSISTERYFDFVLCLVLSLLSAASLASRSPFSRAVFARTAWPAASYSDIAFVASVARSSFCVRFELGFGLGALLRMVGHGFLLEEIATTRRGIFERHRQADKRDPVVVFTRTVLVCTQLIWAKIGKYFYL